MLEESAQHELKLVNRAPVSVETRMGKVLSFEWLGQTAASLCWITSVFVYQSDVSLWGNGDWLQLLAASCWMLSNIAAVLTIKGS